MSVSFDLELGEKIRTAAEDESITVSAWLAEAARARLRNRYLGEALDAWERKFGASFTDEERSEARAEAQELFARAKQLSGEKRGKAKRRGARP